MQQTRLSITGVRDQLPLPVYGSLEKLFGFIEVAKLLFKPRYERQVVGNLGKRRQLWAETTIQTKYRMIPLCIPGKTIQTKYRMIPICRLRRTTQTKYRMIPSKFIVFKRRAGHVVEKG